MKIKSKWDSEIILEHDGHEFHAYTRNLVGKHEFIGYYVENGLFMIIRLKSFYGEMIARFLENEV